MIHTNFNKLRYFFVLTLLLIPLNSASGSEKWKAGIYIEPQAAILDGDIGTSNIPAANLDSTVFSGLIGLEARKGKAGFFIEISGLKQKEKTQLSPYNRMEFRYSITELAGTYSFYKNLDFLLGARHQGFGTKYKGPLEIYKKSTGSLDFFAGLRVTRYFGKEDKWKVVVATDAGAGDSDFVWCLKTELGYNFSKNLYVAGSLRELETDFKKSGIKYDGRLDTLGLKIEYLFD